MDSAKHFHTRKIYLRFEEVKLITIKEQYFELHKGSESLSAADQTNGKVYSSFPIAGVLTHQTKRRGYWGHKQTVAKKTVG